MYTPWGASQGQEQIAEGIISVHTASHGGLCLSEERIKQLPDWYKPFTGDKKWAEEDEDAQIVLQIFGLLTLFHDITTLRITAQDIELGKESRKPPYFTDQMFYGGAISEAHKRIFKHDKDLTVVVPAEKWQRGTMQKGCAHCQLTDEAIDFQRRCDAGEAVKPTDLTFHPYIYVPLRIRDKNVLSAEEYHALYGNY